MAGGGTGRGYHQYRNLSIWVLLVLLVWLMAPAAGGITREEMLSPQIQTDTSEEQALPENEPEKDPAEETVSQPEELPAAEPDPVEPTAAEPVGNDYFADAVFIGDSRTEGFHLYSGLQQGEYLYAVGATVESVFSKPTQECPGGKQTIMEALGEMDYAKAYIMLGVNELGWSGTEIFRNQYAKLIQQVREDSPDAQIVLESILPVSAKQEEKHSYVNNQRIAEYNQVIQSLSEEEQCTYLDLTTLVSDQQGCLREDLTEDGVHLNVAGCRLWLEFLKEHPV